jgi:tRNA(adenine34) deaminase
MNTINPETFMQQALALADEAERQGEVPVGAVVVFNGEVVGKGFNQPITSSDPTAHAEIVALRDAASNLGNYRLADCDLFVTVEPCSMCAGALVHARIRKLFFGANEPKAGAVSSARQLLDDPAMNHRVVWEGGLLEAQCREKIRNFFQKKRV